MRRLPGHVAAALWVAGLLATAGCATTATADRAPEGAYEPFAEAAEGEPAPAVVEAAPPVDPGPPVADAEPDTVDTHELAFTTPAGRPVRLRMPLGARSIGRPNDGRLAGGRCMRPEGPGFLQRKPEAACGTDEAVLLLTFALGEVLREYPDTPPVIVGALSRPEGGPLKPHKSHQSGRDVDIGLYAVNGRPLSTFAELAPSETDFEKTFFLMVNLLATGRVRMILVNYALQPHLYRAAQAMGYDEQQLAWIFQYPRGSRVKAGVIRHSRGHKRHFHVRFACPVDDAECIEHP